MSNYFCSITLLITNRFGGFLVFLLSLLLSFVLGETLAHSQCASVAPAAPTGLLLAVGSNATAEVPVLPPLSGCGALYLTWQDTSSNEDGFKIDRLVKGVIDKTFSVGPDVTTHTDARLPIGSSYCYRVRAVNSAGSSSASNEACSTVSYPLAYLSVITASGGASLTASWSGLATPSTSDWIGVYNPGADDTAFIDWFYLSCTKTKATAKTSGSCYYAPPSSVPAGTYELRLFVENVYFRIGTSATFAVTVPKIN